MSLVDAQMRWMVPFILKIVMKLVEQSEFPVERFGKVAVVLNPGIGFTDKETGADYHALVYIAISSEEDAIQQLAQRLSPPDGETAGPRR